MRDAFGQPIHFSIVRTTDATVEPLTTAEAKVFLGQGISTDDTLIDSFVKAARQKVEADTGRALVNQTWTMTLDKAPSNRCPILLPINPVSSVTSITSYSTADASSTVATSVYRLDTSSLPARIVLKDEQEWPTDLRPENALSIVFVAGYGAAATNISDVGLIQAVRLLMSHWYEHREAVNVGNIVTEVELAYSALIAPHKVPWL